VSKLSQAKSLQEGPVLVYSINGMFFILYQSLTYVTSYNSKDEARAVYSCFKHWKLGDYKTT